MHENSRVIESVMNFIRVLIIMMWL